FPVGINLDDLHYDWSSAPTVTGNTISSNTTGIIITSRGGGSYYGNTIKNNTAYGLYYSGTSIINATNCNWGDPTGPLDDSDDRATGGWYNPDGLGDNVSNHVNYTPWTIIIVPIPGDINHDGKVDLADTVLPLQIMAGIVPAQPVFLDADVNQDDRIGMEEVIYIFQKVAGQR
ncbi:MAG: right-handed parallel beta-helix repeat-containing protein, partial [Desulfosalsimonadaceae bacterium]